MRGYVTATSFFSDAPLSGFVDRTIRRLTSRPGEAVGLFAGLDETGDFPCGEVDFGDLVAVHAGDVGVFAVGADEDFLRICSNFQVACDLHGLEIDYGYFVLVGKRDEKPAVVKCRRGTVADAVDRNPGFNPVGCSVDDGDARPGLVRGEDPLVVD